MAIGTGLALLGSAAIGAAGSYLGGKSQSKAAKDSQTLINQDNASNRAFLTDIYNRNSGYLNPYMTRGNTAGNAIMELLGFGPQASPQSYAFGAPPSYGAYGGGQAAFGGGGMNYDAPVYYGDPGMPGMAGQQFTPGASPYMPLGGVPGQSPAAPSARSAFDTYRGSTGYDFRFNEGTRGLQAAFGRNLDSGAYKKAAIRFGQNIGSDEFGRYMQMLGEQQRLGFGAGSALAGVGQQFGDTVVSGNQAAASAAANARLYAGNANANMWNGLGSSFGQALGAFKW